MDFRRRGMFGDQVNTGTSSGEREMEKEFIKQFYGWLDHKCSKLADYNDSWGITVNQERAMANLGVEVRTVLGNMPIAANAVIFKVVRVENGRVYEFKVKATAIKRGGIRRADDELSIEFMEVPGYGSNPVKEHSGCSSEETIFNLRAFTLVMADSIMWNM